MLRDQMNDIHPLPAIPPAAAIADNTALVSSIIDTQGFESLTFLISTGAETDADATFAASVTHGDTSNLADGVAVDPSDLVGTLALASFDFSADNKTRKLGYIGIHRYVRLTITPTGNTGNLFASAIALLGHPHNAPTPNPPV